MDALTAQTVIATVSAVTAQTVVKKNVSVSVEMGAKKLEMFKIRAYPDQSLDVIKNNLHVLYDSRGTPAIGQNKGGYFLEFIIVARTLQEALSEVLPCFDYSDVLTIHGLSWEIESDM